MEVLDRCRHGTAAFEEPRHRRRLGIRPDEGRRTRPRANEEPRRAAGGPPGSRSPQPSLFSSSPARRSRRAPATRRRSSSRTASSSRTSRPRPRLPRKLRQPRLPPREARRCPDGAGGCREAPATETPAPVEAEAAVLRTRSRRLPQRRRRSPHPRRRPQSRSPAPAAEAAPCRTSRPTPRLWRPPERENVHSCRDRQRARPGCRPGGEAGARDGGAPLRRIDASLGREARRARPCSGARDRARRAVSRRSGSTARCRIPPRRRRG